MNLALAIIASLFYCAAAFSVWRRVGSHSFAHWLVMPALLMHGWELAHQVLHDGAVTIGVSEAASLFAWQSALLLWVFCLKQPLHALGLAIYPLAAASVLVAAIWPTGISELADWNLRLHILLSLLSAGMLTLAAVQACALALQDRFLHHPRQNRLVRALPPLLNMERLLFQLIFIGFFLLTLTLLSGIWFVNNLQSQHLVHKAVLSFSAWLIFGVLLWGRWRHGWRGRTAIRWALSGYGMLILAYLGVKFILEEILSRHWT
jgi:ABC-type uncharacterized transport system permease subunit